MRFQHLLPLLVGEIDIGCDSLIVWHSGNFGAFRLRDRLDHGLHLCKYILLRKRSLHSPLRCSFVIEAVSAGLKLSRFLPSVGPDSHHRCAGREPKLSTDPSHVPAFLIAGSPPEEASPERMPVHHRNRHSHPAILSDSYAVAVETHRHTAVCVPGMYEVSWKVEVSSDYRGKSIVGPLVRGVGSPVNKSAELFLGYGIIEQG